jgi:drug/metabolite transporter (DMT)-like permease
LLFQDYFFAVDDVNSLFWSRNALSLKIEDYFLGLDVTGNLANAVGYFAPIADNVMLACIEFFACGICSLVPALLLEHPQMHLLLAAWLPILYAGVCSNGIAYTLQFFAQRGLPPAAASILMSMESVFSLPAVISDY